MNDGFIGIKLPERDRLLLMRTARKQGLTLSEYVRRAVLSTEEHRKAREREEIPLFAE